MEPARRTSDDARPAAHDDGARDDRAYDDRAYDDRAYDDRAYDDRACDDREAHSRAPNGGTPRAIRPAAPRAPRAAGFERVARLAGNVGYIDLRAFPGPARFAAVLGVVMEGLADADALVLDLRHHRGGSRAAGALLRSWLFDTEPMHVDAVHWSAESRARPARVVPRAFGARFTAGPVYVLLGPGSSDVAREVAASLVALGRARLLHDLPAPPRAR